MTNRYHAYPAYPALTGFLGRMDGVLAKVEDRHRIVAALDSDPRLASDDPAAIVAAFNDHLDGDLYGPDNLVMAVLRDAREWIIGLAQADR